MERLERKTKNGTHYYYYSGWGKVNGKCRRQWQVYLGKLQDIATAVTGGMLKDSYAEIFERGLPLALWKEVLNTNLIKIIDDQCSKRSQGLSVGIYMAIAAINRAIKPSSKKSMWEWFSKTCLIRFIPNVSKDSLSSQRFWDHMHRLKNDDDVQTIWYNLMNSIVEEEKIDLSTIQYDGTNFYTYIDTFNSRCSIAEFGKNKQKRHNLRQVNYSLFYSSEHQIPLFFDAYEGNRNDCSEFGQVIDKFNNFFKKLSKQNKPLDITMIFDRGNNSTANMKQLDEMGYNFVTAIKSNEAKDLHSIPNNSDKLVSCESEKLSGTSAYRTNRVIMGKERTVIVTFNQSLYERELLNIQKNMNKALEKIDEYKHKLDDRIKGRVTMGKAPTMAQAKKKCDEILRKPHIKEIIKIKLTKGKNGIPKLDYYIDESYFSAHLNNVLGKNVLITTRHNWNTDRIILAYRSQYLIEDVFKEMKDRDKGSWWPMHHWTDSKIKVHAFYCSLALLLRGLVKRKVCANGIEIPLKRLLKELCDIKEVVNITPPKGRKKKERKHTVISNTSELGSRLISILGLEMENDEGLGHTLTRI